MTHQEDKTPIVGSKLTNHDGLVNAHIPVFIHSGVSDATLVGCIL